jgi:hypothetical protein
MKSPRQSVSSRRSLGCDVAGFATRYRAFMCGVRSVGWARRVAVPLLILGALAAVGCEPDPYGDRHGDGYGRPDTQAPSVPRGLWSMTGDREVLVMWISNCETDLDGYRVYRNTEPTGYFPRVAQVSRRATSFTDREVQNGVTYYYAISAFDDSGNESELTAMTIHDTPRPEGDGLRLGNARVDTREAGYDFSADRVIAGDDANADIYYWQSPEEGAWMVATQRTDEDYSDIQDAGYLALDDVDWAPEGGWAPAGEVPLVEGHSYIVWTWDNHYAKFRVASVTADGVVIDWAYQVDVGNPELVRPGMAAPPRPALTMARAHRFGLRGRIGS